MKPQFTDEDEHTLQALDAKQSKRKASCHRMRAEFSRGLCKTCYRERHGADQLRRVELAVLHEEVEHRVMLERQAQAILAEALPEYAEIHMKAAKIAAEKGDAKAAEWALTHVRSPGGPIAKTPAKDAGGAGGVKVFVGVQLGGMPDPEAVSATVVDADPVDPTE